MTSLLIPLIALLCADPPPTDATTAASAPADPAQTAELPLYPSAAMAKRHRDRLRELKDAPVHVIASRDALEAGRALCDAVVPKRPPATPVLIKPNLSGIDILKDGIDNGVELRTTGTDFLRGVIRCLKARGHREITLTEAWSRPKRLERWMRESGLSTLVAEEGVRFVPMWEDRGASGAEAPMLRAPFAGARSLKQGLLLPRVLLRHLQGGLYLSVPRMKVHRFAVTSLAIKNTMGFVSLEGASPTVSLRSGLHRELGAWMATRKAGREDRALFTRAVERFAERIVDVFELAVPDAVLIDGIPPVGGDGFSLIEPLDDGVAIGSVNPILAEAVATERLGYLDNADLQREMGHRTSPLLEEAARRFYGGLDVLKGVRVIGDTAFRNRPRVAHFRGFPGFEIGVAPSPAVPLPWIARALVARRVATPPAIDGRLDDAAWAAASPIALDTDWRGRPAGPATVARLAWTPEALYVAFEGAFETLAIDEAAPIDVEHKTLFAWDAVELFLDPTPKTRHTYVEIELGPGGHTLDIEVDQRRKKKGRVEWESGVTRVATIDRAAKRFRIEARIPASAFGKGPLARATWRIALYRLVGRGKDRGYLARFPTRTAKPSFHVPDAFGWLRLTD